MHNCSERHMKFGFGCIQLPNLERPNLLDYKASTSFHVVFCEKAPDQTGRGLSSKRYAGPVLGYYLSVCSTACQEHTQLIFQFSLELNEIPPLATFEVRPLLISNLTSPVHHQPRSLRAPICHQRQDKQVAQSWSSAIFVTPCSRCIH